MTTWKVNDRAFAYWEEDGYWYSATITKINDDEITVRFDCDGAEEVVWDDFLDELAISVDDNVECLSAEDEEYYDAVIKQVKGNQILVEFEDDTTEWVDFSKLRLGSDWDVDDPVFAYSEDDDYWYSAVITKIDAEDITVRYDCDGSEEVVSGDYLDEIDIAIDDEIECLDENDDEYYTVQVKDVEDDRILVEDEDGKTKWVTLDKLRYTVTEE
jgi:hypothetical protein